MSNNYSIRPATMADMAAIQRLHVLLCANERDEGFDRGIPADFTFSQEVTTYLVERLEGRSGIALVAETDARIVGFLVASVRDTRGGPASSLDGVFVMPESRRLGIGAALMRHFLQWHHESGRKEASVAVAPGNEQAVQLYRQAGFVPTTVVLTLSSR